MDKQLAIYVSAAPEMDRECELLGQLLADMTPSIRWTIKRTPTAHEDGNPDLEALHHSQFYLILMGTDIVAPVGVEWMAARKAGSSLFAYHNATAMPTPAASVFLRDAGITWEDYKTPQEFIRSLEGALIAELLRGTPGYGLHLGDIEELSVRLKKLEEGEPRQEGDDRRGAGRGGVILPTTG
jgi:hypothetical protein